MHVRASVRAHLAGMRAFIGLMMVRREELRRTEISSLHSGISTMFDFLLGAAVGFASVVGGFWWAMP